MTDQKKPETISDEDLDHAAGGITLDNGIKRKGIIWMDTSEGSGVKDTTSRKIVSMDEGETI